MKSFVTILPLSTLAFFLILAPACDSGDGGDSRPPPTAESFEGYWQVTEFTVADGAGEATLTRDGFPDRVFGDVVITSPTPATLLMDLHLGTVSDDLIVGQIGQQVMSATIVGDDWQVGESFFGVNLSGDTFTLELLTDDPRNANADADVPRRVVSQRVPMPSAEIIGQWHFVSQTMEGETAPAGVCVDIGDGGFGRFDATMVVTDRLMLQLEMSLKAFSDSACSVETDASYESIRGFVEESGARLEVCVEDDGDGPSYVAFAMSEAGDQLTLSRTECKPMPQCVDGSPSHLVLQRSSP